MQFAWQVTTALFAVASFRFSSAQVSTKCQPLTTTCPNDDGLATSSYFIDFTKTKSQPSDWTLADYEYVNYGPNGAEFTFAKKGDAPTMHSNWKFFFGRIEYVAKAAPGKGIISSMVLLSDDLDEIDWEIGGTWDNTLETNYFGKAVVNYNVAKWVPVTSPQTQFHTYALDWSPTSLVWSIDGKVVRTLTPADAGNEYPQTPMMASLSLWDGGDPDMAKGTQDWAGGITPIPPPENYTMFIKSVKVQNSNPAKQYQYTDHSGSWKSIKIINDTLSSSSGSTLSSTSLGTPSSILTSSLSSTQSSSSLSSTSSSRASATSSSALSSIPGSSLSLSLSNTQILGTSSSRSSVLGSSTYSNTLNSLASSTRSSMPSSSVSSTQVSTSVSSTQSSTLDSSVSSAIGTSAISSILSSDSSAKSTGLTASITTASVRFAGGVSSGMPSNSMNISSSVRSSGSGMISQSSFNHSSSFPSMTSQTQILSTVNLSSLASSTAIHPVMPSEATMVVATVNSQAISATLLPTTFPQYSTLKSTITTSSLDASKNPVQVTIGPSGVAVIAFNHTFNASMNTTTLGTAASKGRFQNSSWLSNVWQYITSQLSSTGHSGAVNARIQPMDLLSSSRDAPGASQNITSKSTNGNSAALNGSTIGGGTNFGSKSSAFFASLSEVKTKNNVSAVLNTSSSLSVLNGSSVIRQKLQEVVTTEIVFTTITSCPVTNTITPPGGTPTQQVSTVLSTKIITSTSTVCTKCVAPGASLVVTHGSLLPSAGSVIEAGLSIIPISTTLNLPAPAAAAVISPSSAAALVSPVSPAISPLVSTGSLGTNVQTQPQSTSVISVVPIPKSQAGPMPASSPTAASSSPTLQAPGISLADTAKSPSPPMSATPLVSNEASAAADNPSSQVPGISASALSPTQADSPGPSAAPNGVKAVGGSSPIASNAGSQGSINAEAASKSAESASIVAVASPFVTNVATTDANGNPVTIQMTVTPTLTITMSGGDANKNPGSPSAGMNSVGGSNTASGTVSVTSQKVIASETATHTNFMINPTATGGGMLGNGSDAAAGTGGTAPSTQPLVSPIAPFTGEAMGYGPSILISLAVVALVFVVL